jgi:hypothetical protein
MARRNRHDADKEGQRKRRSRPPWGKLLGGKPIERQVDLGESSLREEQHFRMRRLLHHYGIVGHVPRYPIAGFADTGWLVWYNLALAIASDLDDSLRIIDAKPRGKTAPFWRGPEGRVLLDLVDALLRKRGPRRSIRWCLRQLQTKDRSTLGQMTLDQLVVRYHEAKRYHRSTKQSSFR